MTLSSFITAIAPQNIIDTQLKNGNLRQFVEVIPRFLDINLPIGVSQIGGMPHLPEDFEWPQEEREIVTRYRLFRKNEVEKKSYPLSFLAQINCAELNRFDKSRLLPTAGMLYFFYCQNQDAWGFDKKDTDKFRVVYTESPGKLRRSFPPEGLEPYAIFKGCSIKFQDDIAYNEDFITAIDLDDDTWEEAQENYYGSYRYGPSKMLGFADPVQHAEMEHECEELFMTDPKRRDLEKSDWQLLFQLSSYSELDMLWCDAGKLYFWIRKADLIARRFDRVWCILQST